MVPTCHSLRYVWLCLWLAIAPASAQTLVDALGRTVTLPDHPQRLLGAAPPLTALLLALAPEHVLALNMPFPPQAQHYLPAAVLTLPVIDSTMDHGLAMNAETVLALQPDLALAWGGSPGTAAQEPTLRFFDQLGVPVFFVRLDTLDDWPAAFELVGRIVGQQQRAAAIADLLRDSQRRLSSALASLPSDQRVRVYYAQGSDGLATECHLSFHVEALVLAGAHMVHRCAQRTMVGMEKIGLEDVIAYDPEFIVVQDAQALTRMAASPAWRQVRAVRTGKLLLVPGVPLNWIDRPPSFMRALGAQWLAHAFYPQRMPDVQPAVRSFYQAIWQVTLIDSDISQLLNGNAFVTQHPGSTQ